jgi:hypothetical protein
LDFSFFTNGIGIAFDFDDAFLRSGIYAFLQKSLFNHESAPLSFDAVEVIHQF